MNFEHHFNMWAIADRVTRMVSEPYATEAEADAMAARARGGALEVVPVTVTVTPRAMPTDARAFSSQLRLIGEDAP